MKQLIIKLLQGIIDGLERDDSDIPEESALIFLEFAERLSHSCEPLTKTEVAELLHCCTKTVERYVKEGYLAPGLKRFGHLSLYWRHSDVAECRRRLEHRDGNSKAGA